MSFKPNNALVWCEIPVTDLDKAQAFYEAVFGYEMQRDDTSGPNPMVFIPYQDPGIAGHLYPGKPAAPGTGPTVHLQVADTVEEALKRVAEAGGTALPPIIKIPAGRFGYGFDPDGNSIGLFQPKAA